MNLKLSIFICFAAILALVVPAAADNITATVNSTATDNNTATVHGEVYSLDTFEPLDNAVVYVNSTPAQSMVAKYGMYSFELEPGNYTISAKYYQNSTVTYSVDDTVNIKNKGNYVHDLLLLPVYSEELMGSSRVNGTSNNSITNAGNPATGVIISNINDSKGMNSTKDSGLYTSPNYLLIALLTLIFLSAAGYLLSRKQKNAGKTFQEEKTAHKVKDFSKPANTPEISVMGQVIEPEPKTSVDESAIESRIKRFEGAEQTESGGKSPLQETELSESRSETEIGKLSPERPVDNPEIDSQDPKKKLPLPSDLQEVVDIIRGQRGRITQKELCSKLRCSDAKVSLMLADLERRGFIEKFKKGRGNVVTLKDEER